MILYNDYPAITEGVQEIEILPKIEGYLEKIYVEEGATVQKGQLLFHISNPEYEENVRTAEASIKSAEANVFSAQLELKKVRALVENKIVNEYEQESAELTLKTNEATLAQAKAALATANTNVQYTYIHSPYDGVIGNIPYRIGALVNSSDALTSLSQNSVMLAYFSMSEKDFLKLNRELPGTSLKDKLSHLEKAQLILSDGSIYEKEGKIESASNIVETSTGSIRLKAVFENNEGLLWSGATTTVRLLKTYNSVLIIPQSATAEILNKKIVYVVDSANKVNSTAVDVIPTVDGQYYIVNSGLKLKDRIVLEGFTNLQDGTEINPQPTKIAYKFPGSKDSNDIQID